MNRYLNIKYAAIMRMFVLVMAVGLTGNAFAAKPDVATQAELDAAVAAQVTVDAGQNSTISTQGASISALQAEIANLKASIEKYHPTNPKKIGDLYGGGIVFFVDATGQHGLIAALSDQNSSDGIQWYNGINKATGATGTGLGAGITNTAIIVAALSNDNPTGDFAAKIAADFSIQDDGVSPCTNAADEICYGDWYLPSRYELDLMYRNIGNGSPLGNVGGFIGLGYWSSTEISFDLAYAQLFASGDPEAVGKLYGLKVRAIRAF